MSCFTSRKSFVDGGLATLSIARLDDEDCFICLQPYRSGPNTAEPHAQEGEEPIQLPCDHVIGRQCILRWTQDSNTCPFCRAVLFETEVEVPLDDEEHGDFEDIVNWEQIWYEATGIDLAYIPLSTWDDPLGQIDGSDAYAPGRSFSRIVNAYHVSVSVEREARCNSTDPMSRPELIPLTISEMEDLRAACDASLDFEDSPFAALGDLPLEMLLEQELADCDVSMDDLIDDHEEWMFECAVAG